jgi:retron-type reverse transcriptase
MSAKIAVQLDEFAKRVVRFNANSNRANLNCNNRNPANCYPALRITQTSLIKINPIGMKTYKNLYKEICSIKNLYKAYLKAKSGKSKKPYVILFSEDLDNELKKLNQELLNYIYKPKKLKKFIIRDPKTRTIHASAFRDRIVHHAIVNIIEPIFEKIFIYDSFASRKNKGTHLAVKRIEEFIRKVSGNGRLIKEAINNNQIEGYCLKADIKSYFDNVNHEVLLNVIKKKVRDEKTLWLIKQILDNFEGKEIGRGMPLGNLTSQFFANVYLNELDYFVKHILKAKYYIRYVDDFVIIHRSKKRLEYYKKEIENFLITKLKIWLHPAKSKIIVLRNGITFLGYRIFFHYKLLVKRNIRFIQSRIGDFNQGKISKEQLESCFSGWSGYAKWANTYKLRLFLIFSIINLIKK